MSAFPVHEDDHRLLQELIGGPTTAVVLRRRAEIILGYSEGRSPAEIAAGLGISPTTVQRWLRAYEKEGMSIFPAEIASRPPGSPIPLDREAVEPEPPPDPTQVESVRPPAPATLPTGVRHTRTIVHKLFDGLREVHRLPEESRALLGHSVVQRARAREGQPAAADVGVSLGESLPLGYQPVLSLLVRGELPKSPSKSVEGWKDGVLTLPQLRILHTLLLLAEALDQTKSQATEIDEIRVGPSWVELILIGPGAQVDCASARKMRSRWSQVTGYILRVMTAKEVQAGETQYFPAKTKSPGIDPRDPLAEAGRKVLRHQFAEMLAHEHGTRVGADIEELHDMRVAVRRMRVCFEIFEEAFTGKAVRKHRRGLRDIGRVLGRVRDMDVFMEKAQRYVDGMPQPESQPLAPLFRHWKQERTSARKKMLLHFRDEKYVSFLEGYNRFVQTEGSGSKRPKVGLPGGELVQHAAPRMIYTRLSSVQAYEPFLKEASIEQFHQLRIEFKRLRYTVEYFREVLGDPAEKVIKTIKVVQDHLGDLNDADVACTILGEFLERWEQKQQRLPLNQRENPESIFAYLAAKHAERHQLMVSFTATWAKFDHPDFKNALALAVAVL